MRIKNTKAPLREDLSRLENPLSDDELLKRIIEVVNTQSEYNKDGVIKTIPIIIEQMIMKLLIAVRI